MSLLRINLTDENQTISEEIHGSFAQAVVAALSADPTTIPELELALGRFSVGENFAWFTKRENLMPYDAGILIVDLAAKLVASDQNYAPITQKGEVCFHDGENSTDVPIRFWISDDWRFVDSIDEYIVINKSRRHELMNRHQTDYRRILYGEELSYFLVDNFHGNDISGCHAKWLTEIRDDLDGKSPRQVLLEHQDRVDFDLYSRELQWSFTGKCPPLIPTASHAYRYAAFGTHEFVIYYDLIRYLLTNFTPDLERLEDLKASWLESPETPTTSRIPNEIIDAERRRLPLEATPQELMIDEDCPICQMMQAEFDTPTFMHLDTANMEDAFEFSTFLSFEEWNMNKKQWEEFNRRFKSDTADADTISTLFTSK
jgi:hypothetical protein